MIGRFLDARWAWIATLLAGWRGAEQAQFASLLHRFNDDIQCHLRELAS